MTVDEPEQAADGGPPPSDPGQSLRGGIAKAAGVDGAEALLAPGSSSDGSLSGDSRELVDNAAAGARLGAKIGATPGAAVGAVTGTAVTAVKNKRTRRRLVIALTAPTLAGVLAWTMVIVALGSMVADRDQNRDGMSQAAAVADGVSDDQIDLYRAAADSSGVPWTLLAAVDRSAGHWSGPGDPPFGITDPDAFGDDLARYGIEPLAADGVQDRISAGYAYGRLFTAKLAEVDRDLDPEDLGSGAGVMTDPGDTDRQVIGVDPEDPYAIANHEQIRNAFEAVLAAMPSSTADDATATFDAAYRWTIGQAQDCGTDPFGTVAGDPAVPRPTGTGARITVSVATWNTLYTNPAARVISGIRSIGAGADVIGLQELSSAAKRRQVAAGISDEWAMYAGGNANNTTPIVWRRSSFDLIAYGAVEASGLVRIEPGASGTAIGPRWITWVQLRQKSTGGVLRLRQHPLHPDDRRRRTARHQPAGQARGLRPGDGPADVAGRPAEDRRSGDRHDGRQHRRPRRRPAPRSALALPADGRPRRLHQLAGPRCSRERRHPRHQVDRLGVVDQRDDRGHQPADRRQLRLRPQVAVGSP